MVVKINHKKCIGAEKCGKCLHICPLGVFMNVPVGIYIPHEKPKKYRIVPYFNNICNNCAACVKVCPNKCIDIDHM